MLEPKDIAKVRRQLGLTQAQLAKLSNVSQSMIAKIESGRIDPSYSKAKSLSEALQRLQRRNSGRIRDVMTREIVFIAGDSTVEEAARVMHSRAISQIPVYQESRPIGSVSEKTVLRLLAEGGDHRTIFSKRVKEVMDNPFPTVGEDTPVEVVYTLLDFFQAVLVVRKDQVVGIVTKADLLRLE